MQTLRHTLHLLERKCCPKLSRHQGKIQSNLKGAKFKGQRQRVKYGMDIDQGRIHGLSDGI